MASLLLKGGTALIHDTSDHVKAIKTDILIEGNKIAKIEPEISASPTVEVIDCTDKIVSPGFIDTHHHLWQTQLKGRHADELLLDYMITGNAQSSNFTPADFFWGELGGCLEAISAGTTTVVDHAHLNYSPEASKLAISATVSSGIRSIFCYCPTSRVASWKPFSMSRQPLEPWVLTTLEELAGQAPFGDGRVTLGLAFDLYFLGKDVVASVFSKAKSLGIRTITSHYVRNAQFSLASTAELLHGFGLLDESILLSHATGATAEDARLLKEANAHVSTTPSTELQMALGQPVCFRDDLPGMQEQSSLGVDCHSNNAGSVVGEMRLALQAARGTWNDKFNEKGKAPKVVNKTVEEVFNLGTIQGARAVGMEDQIGSIAIGKTADLVIFDGTTPAMVCAAQHEPVAAVVLHSSPADIETVIVDGNIRKAAGRLGKVEVDEIARKEVGKATLDWKDVARELLKSREALQRKIQDLDFVEAKKRMIRGYYIDESKLVDEI
ncbi:Metallo-dependent hydrolase [Glonium stellatum]|uniref:Metallo-dependent hydrolase n=1 Tax=Glonium stellatum TaxID=574774 RepID=A0A8E2ENM0_9PEZI|nr:Metallo-dependent hydrolase [Glonium stellatum]